jgi:lantibiotic modifying enzyme
MKNIIKHYIILACTLCITLSLYSQTNHYLDKAIAAEKWLQSVEQKDSTGIFWPNVKDSTLSTVDLYSGNTGIVLFYLELYHTTKNKMYLQKTEQSLKRLISVYNPDTFYLPYCGLYRIHGAHAYTLNEVYLVTKDKQYLEASKKTFLKMEQALALNTEPEEMLNDVLLGYAGIGLSFLYAHEHKIISSALATAKVIGDTLLNKRMDGVRWAMAAEDVIKKKYMPNFSHGTAGISYFFAKLYQASGDKKYLAAALTSGNYLLSLSNADAMIYHAEPDTAAMKRYYLGYCHGPAGTARLYYVLHQISADNKWQVALDKSISYVMNCGIPKKRLPGYWDNVSQCCGNAGIATFYMQLYQKYKKKEYLQFSEIMAGNLLDRAVSDNGMLYWPQVEVRKRPDIIETQTGFMQGSAGIGIMLLQLDAVKKNKTYLIKLPDNPF